MLRLLGVNGMSSDESLVEEGVVHYRIFIKEIGRPLVDFVDWRELLVFVTQALRGKWFITLFYWREN